MEKLKKLDPEAISLLFGSDDESERPYRCSKDAVLEVSKRYITNHPEEEKPRVAKAIQLVLAGRGLGSGKGVAGFTIGGIPSSAEVEDGRVFVDPTPKAPKFELFADEYSIDNGKLVVEYRTGTKLFDFFSGIVHAMESIQAKYVWIAIEY